MFRVLLVDGDVDCLSVFGQSIGGLPGISIDTASDEREAENLLKEHPYDLIISEYQLPDRDGITLLRHVRSRYGDIPFIMLTAYGNEDVAVETSRYDRTGYVRKMADPHLSLSEIEGKIRRERHDRELQQALHEREVRCRTILESQPGMICRFGPNGSLNFANRAFALPLGLPKGFDGVNFSDVIVPGDRASFTDTIQSLSPDKPTAIATLCLIPVGAASDSRIWTEWAFTAVFGPGRSLELVQGMGRDISREREASEQEARNRKNLEFLSAMAMAFVDMDDDDDIYRFIAEKIHALQPGSMVGVCSFDAASRTLTLQSVAGDEHDRSVFMNEFGDGYIGQEFPFPMEPCAEVQFQMKGLVEAPSLYHLSFRIFPEEQCRRVEEACSLGKSYGMGISSRGELLGNIVFMIKKGDEVQDPNLIEAFVNQAAVALLRRDARRALQESEERYKAVVESQNELICRFRPDGTMIFVNDAFCRSFALSGEEITGEEIFAFIHDGDRESAREYVHALTPADPQGTIEHRMILPDGSVRWFQWNVQVFPSPLAPFLEYQSVGRDVTDRRAAEEQLERLYEDLEQKVIERTAELEEANRDLESFSYSVSHDLRAPLRAIEGFSGILMTHYGRDLVPEARALLEKVRQGTLQMSQLIDALLDFSRSGRKELRREEIDIRSLARAVVDEQVATCPGQNVVPVIGPLPPCQADPVLLRQVLQNLVSNALKFSRTREISRIELGSVPGDHATVYYIQDNGIGFDMAYADRVFKVFDRLHNRGTYEGTGIGLAIVDRIVRRHGGGIRVASVPDQGTTFYFTLTGGAPPKGMFFPGE